MKHLNSFNQFIIEGLSKNHPIQELRQSDKLGIVLLGAPGAGKSTFAKNVILPHNRNIKTFSTDDVSLMFTGDPNVYKRGAAELNIERLKTYIKTGQNFIYDTTGANEKGVYDVTKEARKLGYSIIFILILVDLSTAKKQNLVRAVKGGHNVDQEYIDFVYQTQNQTAKAYMKSLRPESFYVVLNRDGKYKYFKHLGDKLLKRKVDKYVPMNEDFRQDDFSSTTPPKGLEEQIAFSMKWYPTLYDSKYGRMKVLDHMFLGYGTEYEWQDGELVNFSDLNTDNDMYEHRYRRWQANKKELEERLEREMDHYENMMGIMQRTGDQGEGMKYLKRIQDDINELQNQIDNFNPYGKEYKDEKPLDANKVHYSEKYSPIFNLPENIKPDYLAGAKEIVSYIMNNTTNDQIWNDLEPVAKKLGVLDNLNERIQISDNQFETVSDLFVMEVSDPLNLELVDEYQFSDIYEEIKESPNSPQIRPCYKEEIINNDFIRFEVLVPNKSLTFEETPAWQHFKKFEKNINRFSYNLNIRFHIFGFKKSGKKLRDWNHITVIIEKSAHNESKEEELLSDLKNLQHKMRGFIRVGVPEEVYEDYFLELKESENFRVRINKGSGFVTQIEIYGIIDKDSAESEFNRLLNRMKTAKQRLENQFGFDCHFMIYIGGQPQQDLNPETHKNDLYNFKGVGHKRSGYDKDFYYTNGQISAHDHNTKPLPEEKTPIEIKFMIV